MLFKLRCFNARVLNQSKCLEKILRIGVIEQKSPFLLFSGAPLAGATERVSAPQLYSAHKRLLLRTVPSVLLCSLLTLL